MVLLWGLRRKLVEGITVRFGSIDFFFEEGRQVGLAVNDLNNFLQLSQDENFLRQPYLRILDSRGRVSRIRDEDSPDVPATIDADEVRSNFLSANRLVPPLHLDQVKHPVNFHGSVNLLDDSLSLVALEGERLPDEKPREGK